MDILTLARYRISHLPLPPHTSDSFSAQDLPLKPKHVRTVAFKLNLAAPVDSNSIDCIY